jgi:CRP/FNR family transcriptional regulator
VTQPVWNAFRACALWSEASDEGLARVLDSASIREFDRGAHVFEIDETYTYFVVVVSGHLRGVHASPEGRLMTLHVHWPGEAVGPSAAIAETAFKSVIEAAEPSTVAVVPASALLELMEAEPRVTISLIRLYTERITGLEDTVKSLNADVPSRVAAFLVRELSLERRSAGQRAQDDSSAEIVNLRMSRAELATVLGTVPETLSRAFGHLRDAGLIEPRGHIVRILDERKLRDLAEAR